MNDTLTPVGKKKPNVRLVGEDGNAFAIMGRVSRGLKKTGHTPEEINQYTDDSTSGDYDHLLRVAMKWCEDIGEDVEDEEDEW